MRLNTKKNGGIVLHADEARALTKAQKVIAGIERHGTEAQKKAAQAATEAIAKVWHSLAGAGQ